LSRRHERRRSRTVRRHLRPEWKVRRILQTREGAEFITSIDDATSKTVISSAGSAGESFALPVNQPVTGEDFDSVCFFIAPIGVDESEHRRHSDAILSSYVEKALATVEPKLRVVRADKITQPGMITKQVLEYLLKSRLVVADLSYHNPNVFYELAVRHATGKPIIHIKRTSDPIPFDNKDFRTIEYCVRRQIRHSCPNRDGSQCDRSVSRANHSAQEITATIHCSYTFPIIVSAK